MKVKFTATINNKSQNKDIIKNCKTMEEVYSYTKKLYNKSGVVEVYWTILE